MALVRSLISNLWEAVDAGSVPWAFAALPVVAASALLGLVLLLNRRDLDVDLKLVLDVPAETLDTPTESQLLPTLSLHHATDASLIQCYDPATGKNLGTIPLTPPDQVQAVVTRTRAAQTRWRQTSLADRKRVLNAIRNFVVANQAKLCRVSARDTGKTELDGQLGEILTTCEKLAWTVKYGERALRPDYHRETPTMLMHKRAMVAYQPLGVQAALVSWNYPIHNMLGPIITALFVGNGIVVKASEYATWSSTLIIRHIQTILQTLGHDPHIVQLVVGFKETGEALVRSDVDHITFIGSAPVGRAIMCNAADQLTPCVLELGGKDCFILRHDCPLDQALPLLMRGVFQNSGQNCIGAERVLVHANVYDELVNRVVRHVNQLQLGAPLDESCVDIGAMTMGEAHLAKLERLVADAVEQGAKVMAGGKRWVNPQYPQGTYFEPTVLVNVTPAMTISQEEHFGPIMVVMGPYKSDRELLAVANHGAFGLGSTIFTHDTAVGAQMALHVQSGMCNVNDFGANYLCQSLPFGGIKRSGYGRFAGYEGIRGVCALKAITVDKFPRIVSTGIPAPLRYPTADTSLTNRFAQALVGLFYARTWWGRIAAVGQLAFAGLAKPNADKTKRD
ncbi:Meiotic Sister-Chromatid recombination aldehyde dehydrogenase [Dimargaris xerosporica]|nr:Meiotic Sister-Chromatid recombination aldehyde dehydrogenase [Dimargaris xerosporica]